MSPLPVVGTGIQMTVTMKHLTTLPDSRENSSCESDIDRQELIDNYGSEKYLSKWNLDVDDDDGGVVAPREVLHQQEDDHKQSENELHHLRIDDDDADADAASLMSYNSVRDAEAPGNNTASYLPYQIKPPAKHINLWQGYGGNIYFDPLRCQPMRLNSSKPHKQNLKDSKKYRKTKSCSPSMEVLTAKHFISSSASSFHSLGSLRFASRDEKRRNASCVSHYGRLRKGYSDGKVTEPNTLSSHHHHHHNYHHHVRCESAPDSLVISGGNPKDVTSDPIDRILKHNIKTRLTSKSKEDFPSLVVEQKCDPERGRENKDNQLGSSTNLPPVETVAPKKEVNEPKPVFIIPFGALDDPVEGNNNSSNYNNNNNINNNNKAVGDASSKRNANKKKSKVSDAAALSDSAVIAHARRFNEPELALSIVAPSVERDNWDERSMAQRVGRASDVNTRVRHEISDSSLSNYLQAVPTQLSKQKKMIAKLSYTKRSINMDPGSLSVSSMIDSDLRISSTSALYGGYLPSTRTTELNLFHAERNSASQTGEISSTGSLDGQRLTNSKLRKRPSNKNIPPSEHDQDSDKCHLPVIGWHVS